MPAKIPTSVFFLIEIGKLMKKKKKTNHDSIHEAHPLFSDSLVTGGKVTLVRKVHIGSYL